MYNILIVDDEMTVVEALETTIPWNELEIETVYTAYSAHQALDIVNTHSIDIVIADIKMPVMSGLELVKELNVNFHHIQCVLLTGYADFDYAKEAISNGVIQYLLKPVSDEDIINTIRTITKQLNEDWENIIAYQSVLKTLNIHKPVLRIDFLNDLLKGRKLNPEDVTEKLKLLDIPFELDQNFAIVAARLEEDFLSYDSQNLSLFEYAISNIAEETFSEHFDMLYGKGPTDDLIFLVKYNSRTDSRLKQRDDWDLIRNSILYETALKLQTNVKRFLKGTISIMVSHWGEFPKDVPALYQTCVTAIRKRAGNDTEFFITDNDLPTPFPIRTIQALYEPPLLNQLLDTGRWEAVYEKLNHIFDELKDKYGDSEEYMLEVFHAISGTFAYYAHKNGKSLEDMFGSHYESMLSMRSFRTAAQLNQWALSVLSLLIEDSTKELHTGRALVIQQAQKYIEIHLEEDISLQSIADHVHLHPVYLSKIYKSETGENLSEYLLRLKMEKASYLLSNSTLKIYEISSKLGYQNQTYFFKVFKKYFGLTPQDYRIGGGIE